MLTLGGAIATPAELSPGYALLAAISDPVRMKAELDLLAQKTEEARKAVEELHKVEAASGAERAKFEGEKAEFEARVAAVTDEQKVIREVIEQQNASILAANSALEMRKAQLAEAVKRHEEEVSIHQSRVNALDAQAREIALRDEESRKIRLEVEEAREKVARLQRIAKQLEDAI